MMDVRTVNKKINELAISYQTTKNEMTLSKLNKLVWNYCMNKTYWGLTNDITYSTRRDVATDTISYLIIRIDKLNLIKYKFVAILAQSFKQNIIKNFHKKKKYVFYDTEVKLNNVVSNYLEHGL